MGSAKPNGRYVQDNKKQSHVWRRTPVRVPVCVGACPIHRCGCLCASGYVCTCVRIGCMYVRMDDSTYVSGCDCCRRHCHGRAFSHCFHPIVIAMSVQRKNAHRAIGPIPRRHHQTALHQRDAGNRAEVAAVAAVAPVPMPPQLLAGKRGASAATVTGPPSARCWKSGGGGGGGGGGGACAPAGCTHVVCGVVAT